jgi:hypothetical protein
VCIPPPTCAPQRFSSSDHFHLCSFRRFSPLRYPNGLINEMPWPSPARLLD